MMIGTMDVAVEPTTEVEPRATRRRFAAGYKLQILEEIDRTPGQSGAILRREGLYSSHLTKWREQRRRGSLRGLSTKRGRKAGSDSDRKVAELEKEVARLGRELEKAQVIIDAQKKLAEILGVDLPKIARGASDENKS